LSVSNDLHPEVRYDMMHMVYVMLPRFGRENWDDCRDAFEQLIFLFKKIDTLPERPKSCKDRALEAIFESAKISNLSSEELMEYERQKKFISDYAAALAYAKDEGISIGDERGVKRGEARLLNRVKELVKSGLSGEELLERLENR